MVKLLPFPGLRPQQSQLADIIAPPYDVIDVPQAKVFATHAANFVGKVDQFHS